MRVCVVKQERNTRTPTFEGQLLTEPNSAKTETASADAQVQNEEPPPLTCLAHRNAGSDRIAIRGLIHRR
jgi:hypothetical protein